MNIDDIRTCIAAASAELSARKEEMNRLNVFPVPDGDTGTNMSLTMESVAREVAALPANADGAELRKAVTHGSLMGARGNSGVITSQILRGLCEGLADATEFSTETIAHAAQRSVEVAFQAVRKPVKGTILTVLEDCANVAQQAYEDGLDVTTMLHAISDEALASVKRTPELLPVLKENGVVDSGGFGLAILIQSFIAALTGEQAHLASAEDFTHAEAKVAIEHVRDWAGSDYMYCTEFLLHSDEIDPVEALEFLASLGDCELLVGAHPDFKVHVHTDTPGTVLTYMTDRGQVSEVFIHNMVLESEERADGIAADEAASSKFAQRKPIAFIAVAAGEGMANILRSLGVESRRLGWPDHEPLDEGPPRCHRRGQRRFRDLAPQQQEHHHGRQCRGRERRHPLQGRAHDLGARIVFRDARCRFGGRPRGERRGHDRGARRGQVR